MVEEQATPQVNDEDVATQVPMIPELGGATLSQLLENYSRFLRGVVGQMDRQWLDAMRPSLNQLIHAMESEREVVP